MESTTTATTAQTIIGAANRIVRRDGVARLTIEAVAREAGLSKGGVLYHFPSKDALVQGMIGALLADFEQAVRDTAARDAAPTGRFLRAYVLASAMGAPPLDDPAGALIAALATDPALLEPVRRRYAVWQAELEANGPPPALAMVVRLAADGLWFADLLGLAPPSGQLRDEALAAMLDLTRVTRPERDA